MTTTPPGNITKKADLSVSGPESGTLRVRVNGDWTIGAQIPEVAELESSLSAGSVNILVLESSGIKAWDSLFLTFLGRIKNLCSQQKITFKEEGLPAGVQRLLDLAAAVPERTGARQDEVRQSYLERVGGRYLTVTASIKDGLAFLGEIAIAFLKLYGGRAQFRFSDLLLVIQRTGADALPIVTLISLLVGLILAFVGAVQLKLFGAEIYVASLVAIAMMRVMGAIMAGIIMAGRTGAAFAAELGTMQVNEEVDAIQTMGISPIEFLVLPRVLGLSLMMPLLCVYADFMGMLGGMIVGVFMLDINVRLYYNQTISSVALIHFWIGLIHGTVFGVLISLTGCLKGIRCGRSAMAVGQVTTQAVVGGIINIVVATAIITVLCNIIGV
ncbi:MAG TPA: ABC transporter permease [Thermodesulfobacteriota bacterium]|nr:ABC transporter permease [Thermodesulfobacteriota bacterium]